MDDTSEREFIRFVTNNGGELWCGGWNKNRIWDNPYQVEVSDAIDKLNEYQKLWIYKKDFGNSQFHVEPGLGQSISGFAEPMIELCKTHVSPEEKTISRGRIWVQLSYWNNENQLVYKPESVKKFYQSLSRWIRKNLVKIETGIYERTGYIYMELVSIEIYRLIEQKGYHIKG